MLETDAKSSAEQAFLVEDTLYTLLSSVQAYTIAQDAIATHLSSGVFSMTLARKHKGVFIAKPEDIREEFTASSTLTPTSDCTFDGSISTNPSDLLQICALPPPPLRKAQQEFRQCLERIVQAQQAIISMRRTLQTIDPTGQPFVIPSIPAKKISEATTVQSISSNVSSSAVSKDAEAMKSPLKSDHVDQQATKLDAESDADDDSDDDDPGFDSDDANNMPLPEILSDDSDEDDEDEGDDE